MAAAWKGDGAVEFPYFEIEGQPFGDKASMKDGVIALPMNPGLGYYPDPGFLSEYSV